MEIKKNPKADLEKDKSLGFLIGAVLGLAVLFVGFEWGERDVKISVISGITELVTEEEIDASTQEEEPPPPEPEPIVEEKIPEVIEEVEDTVEVEHVVIASTEDDVNRAQVETYVASAAVVEAEEEFDINHIHEVVEERPVYPGGLDALNAFLSKNIVYPTISQENGISGNVTVGFVVEIDGSVSDVKILRTLDYSCDREAMRVVKLLSKFTPGKQRGKPVRVAFSVPVRFRMQR